jgi:20S proteasome subunit beta 6
MMIDDSESASANARESRHAALPSKVPAISFPQKKGPKQHAWSPYEDNGGTAAAISGKGFVIVAADTRLNGDFCIHTRDDSSKLYQLTPKTILASCGMQADRLQLQEVLKYKVQWYEYNNAMKTPSTPAIAQLLSTTLYHRRFFPYYTFNIIAGLDDEGNGVCYSYDAVGCTEPLNYGTTGSAEKFVEPLLDCLIRRENMVKQAPAALTADDALLMLKNAFTGAGERDIFTGDAVRFLILTPAGLREEVMPLRKD